MPSDTLPESSDASPAPSQIAASHGAGGPDAAACAAPRGGGVSLLLAIIAAAGLFAAYLLISPDPDIRAAPWKEGSWLHRIVNVQALGYVLQTPQGIEIKEISFQLAASLLSLIGAVALMAGSSPPARHGRPLASPVTWFAVALLCSGASALLCNAPRAAGGGAAMRWFWFAWWWPLALFLSPRHATRLSAWLVVVAGLTAAIGIWHHGERAPHSPLSYPLGNQIFLAACLLPAMVIAVVWAVASLWTTSQRGGQATARRWASVACAMVAVVVLGVALFLTGSRSAALGFWGGVFVAVYLAADRTLRRWLWTAAAILVGLVGGYVLIMRSSPGLAAESIVSRWTGRSDSIRARVEHEWPFAFQIFAEHPLLGGGEGGFGRQVGPLVRTKQIEDPTVLNSDNQYWESHAHNEVLEMLSGIGVLGASAMLTALILTLRAAARAVVNATDPTARLWIIALGGALAAVCCDELTNVALHKPGLPPIAMTLWACLFAMVRGTDQTAGESPTPAARPRGSALRFAVAVLVLLLAPAGGALAVMNASAICDQFRANRQRQEAMRLRAAQSPTRDMQAWDSAVRFADGAERWRLDPARYLNTLTMTIQYRVNAAQCFANTRDRADADQAIRLCEAALQRLADLDRTAPRYLRARELVGMAHSLLAQVHRDRGESEQAGQCAERAREAFRRNRDDEPFRMDSLDWLWRADPRAALSDKVRWLRDFLRSGEIPPEWDAKLRSLGGNVGEAINPMLMIAHDDFAAPQWRDPLSPETFRLAARTAWLGGDSAKAVGLANNAVQMYSRAATTSSPRRFALAHGAALHEQAEYAFDNHGFGLTQQLYQRVLDTLRRAEATMGGDPTRPLGGGLGRTQLRVMLFTLNEEAARATADRLADETPAPKPTPEQLIVNGYLDLARQFGHRAAGQGLERLNRWIARAQELQPDNPAVQWYAAAAALQAADVGAARTALERYRQLEADPKTRDQRISLLRARYPASPLWSGAATQGASQPASAPDAERP